ncbi:MAG: DUF748 domain-containing protein [Desulfobacteraceae bacterium]|nr:DUF748 domain-containing protein [Desulfobacteraceae bacterium]MBC2719033.1 DUF748 domain-containing protein [Desulfobacteraceae bacterium]
MSRTKKGAIITAILISLYGVFGFLIVPYILKANLISGIVGQLGRNATVNEVKVNPFVLSVTVRGFEMSEPDGERFVGFEELYVNFQFSSIFRRAYTFDEIRMIAPDVRVKVLPNGSLNFSDLLASSEPEEPRLDESNELPPILIFRLQIEEGRLEFSDFARSSPFEMDFFPIQISLNNFSTHKHSKSPYAFTATTGKGEVVSCEGNISVDPFGSQGRFVLTGIKTHTLWEYIQDQVHFEVTGGLIDLAARYDMDAGEEVLHFEVIDGELELNELTLVEKGVNTTLISVPCFSVKGVHIDLSNKKAICASVNSNNALFKSWLTSDGTLNYQALFAIDSSENESNTSSETQDQPEADSQPWRISIKELTLENYGVALEGRTLVKPMHVNLEPINLNLKNLSNQKDSQAELVLTLKVNQTGTVGVKGLVSIDPISMDLSLQVARIALKSFQSYVDSVAQLELVTGTAGLDGKFQYRTLGSHGPEMSYKGSVSINSFEAVDRLHSEDFLKWESLLFNGLLLDVQPDKLSISEIVANQPYARVIIWPDSTVNLTGIFSTQDGETTNDVDSEVQSPIPVTIDTVCIENASVNFSDLSLKPNFAIGIQSLNGTIRGLSSNSLARADVLLEGKVDKYAPVKIAGQINPLSEDVYTDLALFLKNIELSTFTPYSGKFTGYAINKGKLLLDLKYKLSENLLVGENKIFADQFTFGERIDSPDATTLPVRLAVALLRDREGKIDIDLPVRGDLNDPEFSYGRIMVNALVNLITKIVSSPFDMLADLVGGDGEGLSFVEFEFGSAALGTEQIRKLEQLAKGLHKRPALRVEIKGVADTEHDRVALAEAELLSQLKRAKLEEPAAVELSLPVRSEDISLSDEDYAFLITQAYADRFGEHPMTLFKIESETSEPPQIEPEVLVAAAKQRLIEKMAVDETSLRRLAQERAKQIKDHLILKGEIPNEQVFMVEIKIDHVSDADTIGTNLTLSGI